MNIRKVVTYNALRKGFAPEELALADALYNASESERELLIQSLQPEKVTVKKTATQPRKIQHCEVCDYTRRAAVHKDATLKDYHGFQSAKSKSAHAQSLAEQIKGGRKGREPSDRCAYVYPGGGPFAKQSCTAKRDNVIHDKSMGYAGYHEFVAGKSTAPSAAGKSSTNGAEETIATTGAGD